MTRGVALTPASARSVPRDVASPGRAAAVIGFHLGPALVDLDRRSEAAIARVLGATAGIVRSCQQVNAPGLPGLSVRVARGPKRIPGWSLPEPIDGTGVAFSPTAAERAAVGEAVEAYCFYAPAAEERMVRAAHRELGPAAIAPDRFAWPSARQYRRLAPLQPLIVDRVVDWCPGWSLTHRRAVLVPAALVHAERGRRPPNEILPELTSTGLAAHVSVVSAALSGLCEALERDAIAIAWFTRLPLTRLRSEGTVVADLVRRLREDGGLDVELLGVPTDGPFPVVIALARPADGPPWAALGAACRPDPVEAAQKAVAESGQVLLRLDQGGEPPQEDAAMRYATGEGARELARCLVTAEAEMDLGKVNGPATGDAADDLAAAVEALTELDLEVVVADLTTPDMAAAGWRVVRVLVPGMVTTGTDIRFAPLGAPRLYDVPVRLGLQPDPGTEDQLRALPVPLA